MICSGGRCWLRCWIRLLMVCLGLFFRSFLNLGFPRLRRVLLSFASPKESKQRKGDPWVGAGYAGPLRYSPLAGAAELGPAGLRQCSPFIRQRLRYSAPLKGPGKPSVLDGWFGFSNLGIFSAR